MKLRNKQENKFQKISIIIAARNEENNLPNLLDCLKEINYPQDKFEIIISNDRSTDRTKEILQDALLDFSNLKIVDVEIQSEDLIGKKGALDRAIKLANFEILAFTDADCIIPRNWLRAIDQYFTDDVDFLAGYSPLSINSKFLGLLKNLERASIFAVTAGSFGIKWAITCTARNMAYRKSVFNKIDGFKGIGHIRSGDDDLMVQKMSSNIRAYNFMFTHDSIVPSLDKSDLKTQMNLESRRASKWKYYPTSIKLLSLFVFVFYMFFIFSCGLFVIGNIPLTSLLLLLIIKILPEFMLLFIFLCKTRHLRYLIIFPLAELLYIPYFIFFGIKGTFGKYKWKI